MYRLLHQLMVPQTPAFDDKMYSNLQTESEEYKSKVHINKNFLQESKKIRKQYRINKRDPSSKADYYKKLSTTKEKNLQMFKNLKADHVQQTSIPNCV
jgi:hypothetical protein